MSVLEMNILVWLFITQLLLLFSAAVCLFAGYLVARTTPNDWLYRLSRIFFNELSKRPPKLAPPVLADETTPGEVDEDLARLAEGEEPAAASSRKAAGRGTPAPAGSGPRQTMLHVNVIANGDSDEVIGRNGEAFNIQVTAPAEAGLTNKAVIQFLADRLEIKSYQIHLVKGHYQTSKVLRIAGMDPQEVQQRLSPG